MWQGLQSDWWFEEVWRDTHRREAICLFKCDKAFKDRGDLKKHEMIYTREKPFEGSWKDSHMGEAICMLNMWEGIHKLDNFIWPKEPHFVQKSTYVQKCPFCPRNTNCRWTGHWLHFLAISVPRPKGPCSTKKRTCFLISNCLLIMHFQPGGSQEFNIG